MQKLGFHIGNGNSYARERIESDIQDIAFTPSRQILVHKYWKTIFIVVFVLSKVFLATSIYFFLEYKHAQEKLTEVRK
ncbi:hypothetical protein [Filimonas lacunae]|nr:hypothetical protein [Filimonas lacunae]